MRPMNNRQHLKSNQSSFLHMEQHQGVMFKVLVLIKGHLISAQDKIWRQVELTPSCIKIPMMIRSTQIENELRNIWNLHSIKSTWLTHLSQKQSNSQQASIILTQVTFGSKGVETRIEVTWAVKITIGTLKMMKLIG